MLKCKYFILTILLGALIASIGCGEGAAQVMGKARDFELRDSDGNLVRLSSYAGRPIVLNFFATWCPPCRTEIPEFTSFQKAHSDVTVIGIMLDANNVGDALRAKDDLDIGYPVLADDGKASAAYGPIRAIPTTFIIDKDFNIIDKRVGAMNRAELEEKLGLK